MILFFFNAYIPFIDKISKKGVNTNRNLCYLWVENERIKSEIINIINT
jgi:hypothetical protein